jgi:hypothetical protein
MAAPRTCKEKVLFVYSLLIVLFGLIALAKCADFAALFNLWFNLFISHL